MHSVSFDYQYENEIRIMPTREELLKKRDHLSLVVQSLSASRHFKKKADLLVKSTFIVHAQFIKKMNTDDLAACEILLTNFSSLLTLLAEKNATKKRDAIPKEITEDAATQRVHDRTRRNSAVKPEGVVSSDESDDDQGTSPSPTDQEVSVIPTVGLFSPQGGALPSNSAAENSHPSKPAFTN